MRAPARPVRVVFPVGTARDSQRYVVERIDCAFPDAIAPELARASSASRPWISCCRCSMPDPRILPVNGDDLLALKDEVSRVHADVFGTPPTSEGPAEFAAFEASLPAHVRKPGFRACTARADDGRLVAFAYGREGGPGDWW